MNHKLKIFIILIVVLVLSFFLAEQAGIFYEKITNYQISGDWIGKCPKCFDGFIVAFTFLVSLLFFSFLDKNRLNITLGFMLIMPVFSIILGDWEAGFYTLVFGLVGLGLGQLIYLTRKAILKKKKTD